MTPIIFAVLLALAIALLAVALWVENAAFGVASASIFLILAGLFLGDGLSDLPGYANVGIALVSGILAIGLVLQFALGDSIG